jgi:Na+-driven multidrug efflux pump
VGNHPGLPGLYTTYHELRYKTGLRHVFFRPDLVRICQLLAIRLPAAMHVTLEVGVFAVAMILAGMLDPVALAAHHIVLDISSVTFMIPLGVSTGTMRGTGDTHAPMVCNLVAHCVIGLPLGYLLAFTAGCGIIGLWVGLALGLGASGLYLLRA